MFRRTLSVLAVITFAACDCGGGGGGGGAANQAPVLSAIGDKSVQELQALSFVVHATDTAGSTLTLSATGVPAGAAFNKSGGDGTFTWTPAAGTAGTYTVTFKVTDGEKTAQEQVAITVTPNQAPVLSAIGAKSVEELQPLSFAVHATDAAWNTLTLSATGLPTGATFDKSGGDGTFSWTPGAGTAGTHTVTFQVSDGDKTDEEQVVITVAANQAPVLAPIGSKVVHELEELSFAVHATDAAWSTLTLSATGVPDGATFTHTAGDGTFTWTPAAGKFGSYEIAFKVSDGDKEDTETVRVTVLHPAPAAAAAGPTVFLEYVENQDPDREQYLPGAANVWDLDQDLALLDGGNNQFDGALELHVGTAVDPLDDAVFPLDQTYAELAFATPDVTDGLAPVAVDTVPWAYRDLHSAWIAGTSGSALYQDVDLTGATAPITLSFDDTAITGQSKLPSPDDVYRVVVRNTAGEALATLLESTDTAGHEEFSLDAYAGQVIRISFELVGGGYDAAALDAVSIVSGGDEYVQNGGFEDGLNHWQWSVAGQSQNLTSASRTVGGLEVTRSFYTLPTQKWARWVDVFENKGEATVVANASYLSVLGAGGAAVISQPDDWSLSAFDGAGETRDVGWVFAGPATVPPATKFKSASGLGATDGSGDAWVVFPISVPPGGKVAIVNFLVLSGVDTGSLPDTTIDTHPGDVGDVMAAILAGWGIDPVYQDYMTTAQLAAVLNF